LAGSVTLAKQARVFEQWSTLRDHFAGIVLRHMLTNETWNHLEDDESAVGCYEIADAMIRARVGKADK
jgi:hypothetical protein